MPRNTAIQQTLNATGGTQFTIEANTMGLESIRLHAPLATDLVLTEGAEPATFTRASVASHVVAGIVTDVASGDPRFGADGLLMEGSARQVLAYTDDFTNARWNAAAGRVVVTNDATTTPDGGTSNSLMTDDDSGGTNTVFLDEIKDLISTGTWTFSVYAKAGTITTLGLQTNSFDASANGESYFDLTAGTAYAPNANHTSAIEPLANDWYRCSITFTTTSDANGRLRIRMATANGQSTNVPVDGTSTMYVWRANAVEAGFASSPIFNDGASFVDRQADVLTYPATDNWPTPNNAFTVAVTQKSLSAGIASTIVNPAGLTAEVSLNVNTSDQLQLSAAGVTSTDTTNLATASHRSIGTWLSGGDQKLYTDTVLMDTDTASNTANTVTAINVGGGTAPFYGYLTDLRIYDDELSQADIDNELNPSGDSPILTTPYSIEIAPGDTADSATGGTIPDVVTDKFKLYLGSSVDMNKKQSIVGSLVVCYNKLMTDAGKGGDTTTNTKVARANYIEASQTNVTIEAVTSNIGVNDVAIVVDGNFGSARNQTIEYREAFRKLVAQILHRSTGN